MRRRPRLVLTLPVMAACDRSTPEVRTINATVRDSAGIEIVENHTPVWSPADSWTQDPEPEFVIGG